MKRNSEIRHIAVEKLSGNWGIGACITIVYGLIYNWPNIPRVTDSLGITSSLGILSILLLPIVYGYEISYLEMVRGKKLDFSMLFEGFKDYGRILGTTLLVAIYTLLWTLLLIIPGIIKAYSYSMTSFILKDNPELQYNGAIDKSMEMMRGKKMKLFILDLSFIGWAILSLFTLGIGFLFLSSYIQSSHAVFYEELKNELTPHSVEIIEE